MKYKLKTLVIAMAIAIFSSGSAQAYGEPYCREYTETFQIGGRTQQGYGTACLQPDGTWQKQGDASVNESYEQQKQNVVYVIDRQPVEIYRPYNSYGYLRPYRYSQPSTFFSISLGENYGYRPNYYHNHGYYHNHRSDRDCDRGHGWNNYRQEPAYPHMGRRRFF